MSYREIRQFTEIIRTLGCTFPVGIDSFDTPNFILMAKLLQWLSTLYDPDIVIIPDLSSESGRVEFIKSTVQQMAIRSGLRLNPRKLYLADRSAVRELLKIAAPIYRGITSTATAEKPKAADATMPSAQKISKLSTSIPKHSVELYDQLDKELMIRETRTKILSTMPPLEDVEKSVISAIESAGTRLDTLTKELDRLNSDEDTFRSKIKQRKHELERQSKRLLSVQTIRPAFMDEYENLEQELQMLFKIHFQHYRNVDYYEHELQKAAEKQKQKKKEMEKAINKMKKKVNKSIVDGVEKSFKIGGGAGGDMGNAFGGGLESDDLGVGAGDNDSDDSF
ncbi:clusterin associated protein [Tritrichomonas foetus]|uniref:Clusterin associated protein n=1 Tax=Tritrichomonas foetus TaxID=1144522 RepID=A0A1J4KNA9_9EUKA|nr:clusterin associated protein [Tritrichomonas foetus]|eukprot:OHT12801.1 clusterin associated protein [Tritrichomonas foetus]